MPRVSRLATPHPCSTRVVFVEILLSYWPWFTAVAALALHLIVFVHIVFHKRDSRSAVAWIALVWFLPFLGSLLYFLLGINRVERRARRVRHKGRRPKPLADAMGKLPAAEIPVLPQEAAHLAHFVRLSEIVTGHSLSEGNAIEPLWEGDRAYPAMLQAIEDAKCSVGLSMYIFNNDRTGNRFAEALGRAVARGVEVRVLIDDLGARYDYLQRSCQRLVFWPRSGRAPLPMRISATIAS
jgi:cardiolipin synthase